MEVETKSACCARRPAAAGGRETLIGVPTRVDVRSKAFSDAGSTPAASTRLVVFATGAAGDLPAISASFLASSYVSQPNSSIAERCNARISHAATAPIGPTSPTFTPQSTSAFDRDTGEASQPVRPHGKDRRLARKPRGPRRCVRSRKPSIPNDGGDAIP